MSWLRLSARRRMQSVDVKHKLSTPFAKNTFTVKMYSEHLVYSETVAFRSTPASFISRKNTKRNENTNTLVRHYIESNQTRYAIVVYAAYKLIFRIVCSF